MKNHIANTGSEREWSIARSRLHDYLRALDCTDVDQRNQIISRLLERAAGKLAANPGLCPTMLAMAEAHAALDQWFEPILALHGHAASIGVLSLRALGTPERLAAALLAEPVPANFQRDLLTRQVRGVPDLNVSPMVPQPFTHRLHAAIQWPILRGKLALALAPRMTKAAVSMLSLFSTLLGIRLR